MAFFPWLSIQLTVFSQNCSYFGQENGFIFCDMPSIGEYQRTSRRMWYRFQVICRSQFSRINVSIKWRYKFNFLLKNVYQITLSFSFLANLLVILQASKVLRVKSFSVSITTGQTKFSSLYTYRFLPRRFIAVQLQSIPSLKKQRGFHTSCVCKLLFTSVLTLLTQLILLSRNHHLFSLYRYFSNRELRGNPFSQDIFCLHSFNVNTENCSRWFLYFK